MSRVTTTAICPQCKASRENQEFYTRECCLDKPRASTCACCLASGDKFCLYCLKQCTFDHTAPRGDFVPASLEVPYEADTPSTVNKYLGCFSTGGYYHNQESAYTAKAIVKTLIAPAFTSLLNKNRELLHEHNSLKERNRQLTCSMDSLMTRYYQTINQNAALLEKVSTLSERCDALEKSLTCKVVQLEEKLEATASQSKPYKSKRKLRASNTIPFKKLKISQ